MSGTSRTLLIKQALLPTQQGLRETDLLVRDGRVAALAENLEAPDAVQISARGDFLLPGLVDVHTNGAAGFDFSFGLYNPREKVFDNSRAGYFEGFKRAAEFYVSQGATSVLLTTISAPVENLEKAFRYFAEFKHTSPLADVFEGLYIEGSFILDTAFSGAHNPAYFLKPSWPLIRRWQEMAEGAIRVVNLPPEHGKLALDLIPKMRELGILTVAGHSGAYFDEFEAAERKGLRGAIHLFNGPMRSFYKPFRGGGAFEAALALDSVFAELICDFYHVDPRYLRDAIARKTPRRILTVTDSMFVAGIEEIGTFEISGIEGKVSSDRGYLEVREKPGTLFGSVLTMKKALENLVYLLQNPGPGIWQKEHEGLGFGGALFQAVQMCSLTPQEFLEREHRGLIPGAAADFLLARIERETPRPKVTLHRVFKNGRELLP